MTNLKKDVKILALFGSPRKKGNSTLLASHIILGAESRGAIIESIYLNGLNIKPCQGCYACQEENSKGCAVDDDMQGIYPKITEADALIIASPVYWFTMSAQTKIFMDRCIATYNEDPGKSQLHGKKIAIAMTFGDKDAFSSGCVNALRTFQDAYNFVGADIVGMVYGSAEEPGEIAADTELMKDAEALGKKLVSGE
ncbi:MAG: flavodoxin family protein [Deltaproteobacteria bacterium]|nr:flavodoxin family protein [Deltaproteobacteria bacterium]